MLCISNGKVQIRSRTHVTGAAAQTTENYTSGTFCLNPLADLCVITWQFYNWYAQVYIQSTLASTCIARWHVLSDLTNSHGISVQIGCLGGMTYEKIPFRSVPANIDTISQSLTLRMKLKTRPDTGLRTEMPGLMRWNIYETCPRAVSISRPSTESSALPLCHGDPLSVLKIASSLIKIKQRGTYGEYSTLCMSKSGQVETLNFTSTLCSFMSLVFFSLLLPIFFLFFLDLFFLRLKQSDLSDAQFHCCVKSGDLFPGLNDFLPYAMKSRKLWNNIRQS